MNTITRMGSLGTKTFLIVLLAVIGLSNSVQSQYSRLHDFLGSPDGKFPHGELVMAGNYMYGMTSIGGANNLGTIFKIKPDGTSYLKILDFAGTSNGSNPDGGLIYDGTFLYGMTRLGGANSLGLIFKILPDGTGYTKLLDFNTTNGSNPSGSLLLKGGFMYGMTANGGVNSLGNIFKIDINGNNYSNLFNFAGTSNGKNPYGSLISLGSFLYGITPAGGANNLGVIFKVMDDGTAYADMHDFVGTADGSTPKSSLVFDGTYLYGTTNLGGANNCGTVFKILPNGTSYSIMHDFDIATGRYPFGPLLSVGSFLYGMTQGTAGGTGDCIYKISTTGTYTKILDFDGNNGTTQLSMPTGSLISDGRYIYGMTTSGSATILGTVFKFSITAKELWGMTANGGAGLGVIFKTDGSGDNEVVEYSFPISSFGQGINGGNPEGSLLRASDDMLYGMTLVGGTSNAGVIFQFNPCTHVFTKKLDFVGVSNGSNPIGSLMQASNGKLYGLTQSGGLYGFGVIFQIDISGGGFIYTKMVDFDGTAKGSDPWGDLIEATDGKLYGITHSGGANNMGVIFQYTPGTSTCINKYNFTGTTTADGPYGSLLQASDGKLYGMTNRNGTSSYGVLYQFDINPNNSNPYTVMVNFTGANGVYPYGSLIEASPGNLYGMTSQGGLYGQGNLFLYTIGSTFVTNKVNFTGSLNVSPIAQGKWPSSSLLKASDGNLYGLTFQGTTSGGNSFGVLFQYNISSNQYTNKLDFNGANGENPYYTNLIEISAPIPVKELWGMTQAGGINNVGVIFKTNGTGNNQAIKYSFGNQSNIDGSTPQGSLFQASNGMLYGMTLYGGINDKGVLFEFNPTTNVYNKKLDFNGTNGSYPTGSLMQALNGKLYGMTQAGGSLGYGVLFEVNLSGGNFAYSILVNFDGATNGGGGMGNLIQATNGKLYGISRGLANPITSGALFEYTIGNSNIIVRHNFTVGSAGSLVQFTGNGMLYGMEGGSFNQGNGTVFQYDPINFNFSTMVNFAGYDGKYPTGSLIEASGNLYGMTSQGGTLNGNLFKYTPGNLFVTSEFSFTGGANVSPPYVGQTPSGSLLKASDGNLYGMTTYRSNSGFGNIFRYNYTTHTFTETVPFAPSTTGSYPYYTNLIETSQCTSNCISPPSQPSAITGPTYVCGLSTATYTVTAVTGVTYTWTLRPGMLSPVYNAAGNSVMVTIDQTVGSVLNGNITVTATNACGTSAARIRLINLIPGTPAALTGPNRLCGLTSATYTCTTMGTGVTYNWVWPAGMTGPATTTVNTATATMTGIANITGSVTVTPQNACGTGGTKTRAVNSSPSPLSAITGPTDICSSSFLPIGVSKIYYVTALPPNQFISSYTWTNVGGGISFAPNAGPNDNSTLATFPSGYPASSNITVKATNQCNVSVTKTITVTRSNSSTCTARPIVARSANEEDAIQPNISTLNVYPNPSNGVFSVKFNSSNNYPNLKMEIVNLLGQTIHQSKITNPKSEINISNQPSGMYIMRLIDKSGAVVERRKLIKE